MSWLLDALLLRAEERRRRAALGALVGVLLLALAQVGIVRPLIELERQAEGAGAAVERLDRWLAVSGRVGQGLERFEAALDTTLDPAFEALIEGLRGDFERLESTRDALRIFLDDPSEPPDFGAAAELRDVLPFEVDNSDWIVALSEAEGRRATLIALAPMVEELVLRPRFGEINRVWTTEALPVLEAQLDGVAGEVPRLRGEVAEAALDTAPRAALDGDLEAIARELGSLRRALRDVLFLPPEPTARGGVWWTLDRGPSPGEEEPIVLGMTAAIEEQLRAPLVLDTLRVDLERLHARHGELQSRLEALRRDTVEARRGEGPAAHLLRLAALDPRHVTGAFPAVLGVLLAALLLWPTRAQRERMLLAGLRIEDGDADEVRDWLLLTAGLGRRPAAPRAVAGWSTARDLVIGLAGLVWIVLAAGPPWPVPSVAIGGVAWTAAVLYRLVLVRSLWLGLASSAAPPSARFEAWLDDAEPADEDFDSEGAHEESREDDLEDFPLEIRKP